jgi:hypothetical protein
VKFDQTKYQYVVGCQVKKRIPRISKDPCKTGDPGEGETRKKTTKNTPVSPCGQLRWNIP